MVKFISQSGMPEDKIFSKIHIIRNQRVLLDVDLAQMYGVETKVLNQAVKRNLERFPEDFMFQLTENEDQSLRSQFVTSKIGIYFTSSLPFSALTLRSSLIFSLRFRFTSSLPFSCINITLITNIFSRRRVVSFSFLINRHRI